MLRNACLTVMLTMWLTTSAQAQIVSNPVVTSLTPYAPMTAHPLPAAAPVAADVCTPPVVTYYSPTSCCAPAVVPATAYRVAVPTTLYYAPPRAVFVVPSTTAYRPLARYRAPLPPTTVMYSASTLVAPAPVMPTTSYYAPAVSAASPTHVMSVPVMPTTSYYAPAVSAAPVMSAPVAASRGCGCSGR